MKPKINTCHQLEWIRGYVEASIRSTAEIVGMPGSDEWRMAYYMGQKAAFERLLRAINDTFEGGERKDDETD